jgi:hypothetical protein
MNQAEQKEWEKTIKDFVNLLQDAKVKRSRKTFLYVSPRWMKEFNKNFKKQ